MLNLQTDFHAQGDGVADDSAAVQAAFTYFGTHAGALYVPQGVYRLTNTIQYTGTVGGGMHLVGDLGGTRGPLGTQFLYDGPLGAAALHFLGLNGSTLENFEVRCQDKALYGLWLDATNTQPGGSPPSSGNVLCRLTVSHPAGSDCAAIAFGHANPQTMQVSEVSMYDLVLTGGGVGAGIKMYNAGNVKNFLVGGGTINGFAHAIDWLNASGTLTVRGTICGNIAVSDFVLGAGCLLLEGIESESSGSAFVLGSTGANAGSLVCHGCSWQGSTAPDDFLIQYSGAILLAGNQFLNYRTPTSWPKIALGGEPRTAQRLLSPCSLYSVGNFYRNHPGGIPPFYDGSANLLLDPAGYYGGQDVQVTTLGDYGGVGGALTRIINHLPQH